MNLQSFRVVSPFYSLCCTIVSAFGILFLLTMSALYSAGVEEVLEGPATPSDGKAAARSTFFAALIYVFLFGFCYFQNHLNNLQARNEERLGYINSEERQRLNQ